MSFDASPKCRWCGKHYSEHAEVAGAAVPKMPCKGLKAHFLAIDSVEQPEKEQTYGEAFVDALDQYIRAANEESRTAFRKNLKDRIDEMFRDAVQWHE